jgi:hypothetical protein
VRLEREGAPGEHANADPSQPGEDSCNQQIGDQQRQDQMLSLTVVRSRQGEEDEGEDQHQPVPQPRFAGLDLTQ